MTEVIVQAPTSSEKLESELLNFQPSGWRRLARIGAVLQTAPARWWLARRFRTRSESDLSKVPIYPGA
jgi:hypothetical protein